MSIYIQGRRNWLGIKQYILIGSPSASFGLAFSGFCPGVANKFSFFRHCWSSVLHDWPDCVLLSPWCLLLTLEQPLSSRPDIKHPTGTGVFCTCCLLQHLCCVQSWYRRMCIRNQITIEQWCLGLCAERKTWRDDTNCITWSVNLRKLMGF